MQNLSYAQRGYSQQSGLDYMDPTSGAMIAGAQPMQLPTAADLAGFSPTPTFDPATTGLGLGSDNWLGINGLGKNLQTLQLGLGGLNTLGSLWGASQALGLARKQFDFTKSVTNTNLANQIKSYNTALADRAHNRVQFSGAPQSTADAYVDANKLTRSA